MTARYIVGDSCDVLRSLPDGSVDLVLTSPPFLALRSYLPADHPAKHLEMGSEPTPGDFIDSLLGWTEECARVLAPHGSLVVELGDTYSGSGGAGGDYAEGGLRDGAPAFVGSASRSRSGWHRLGARAEQADQPPNYRKSGTSTDSGSPGGGDGWPLPKSLCLIPELYRVALVYGFNPLTGRLTEPWRARNVVRWHRPNPPVGALGDKFRPATSDMVVACKSRTRYFDLDAVRYEPTATPQRFFGTQGKTDEGSELAGRNRRGRMSDVPSTMSNPAGAPPLDTWTISTEPYKGSHYATWPTQLLTKPILAMCPQRVCVTCGEPSRRIVEGAPEGPEAEQYLAARAAARHGERLGMGSTGRQHVEPRRLLPTGAWTDCGHDTWRPGVVLDPFAGSGTTLAVATGHGRHAIGIDLDSRNADLAYERVGMFLTVEHHEAGEVVA